MFIEPILSVVVFSVIYILPLIGVVFSQQNNKRWLGHWLITLFAINVLVPILSVLFSRWFIQCFIIFLGVFRLLKFTNEKVTVMYKF